MVATCAHLWANLGPEKNLGWYNQDIIAPDNTDEYQAKTHVLWKSLILLLAEVRQYPCAPTLEITFMTTVV